jgi:UDP-N-acetylglucosamine 2-epimerase (non-hydrolysing)
VTAKLHITVGRVEAGLRKFDRLMPEEINRIVADHVSDQFYAPTENSREKLLHECINAEKITITGNTVVDAIQQNIRIAQKKCTPFEELGLEPGNYFLVTAHRSEIVDDSLCLAEILTGLKNLSEQFGYPTIFPMHPKTQKMLCEFSLSIVGI